MNMKKHNTSAVHTAQTETADKAAKDRSVNSGISRSVIMTPNKKIRISTGRKLLPMIPV